MAQVHVELFGAFRLFDGAGREVPVRSAKLRALIAYLVLHPDQPIKRETLAGLLWGESPDAQARQSLRQALLALRKTLGDAAAFHVDDESVTFRSTAAHVDVDDFERGAAEGRLEDAVAAYRADLMEEPSVRSEPFEAWLAQERTRLRDLACGTLEAFIERLLQDGDASTAVQAGKQIEALDPWRETGTRLLMEAYARAGRRAEAMQHYRTFAETLQRELGADPDIETTRLFEDIRKGVSLLPSESENSGNNKGPAKLSDIPARLDRAASGQVLRSRAWLGAALAAVVICAVAGWGIWDAYLRDSSLVSESTPKRVAKSTLSDKPSIAVLPFNNMSGDESQEYFADGITEDIITGLSKFGLFFVISRNSTFTYKGGSPNVKDVARDLGAQYVLEGSVRKSGGRLRITAQLVDATADKHIWAEHYDRELKDLFQVQDEITQSIVTSVAPEYLSAEMHRAQRKEERNLDAWDAFMQSYWHFFRFTVNDNAAAKRLVRKAIELDSHRASYHGLLAVIHTMDALYGWSESRDASFRVALESAERALAIDDQDTLAIRSAGAVHFFSKNHDVALGYYKQAVAANPNEAENRALLGSSLGVAGDYDGALEQFEIAFRLSPRDAHTATWYNYLAVAAFVVGRDKEAAEWAEKTAQASPQFPGGHRSLAASYGNLGRIEEAAAAREKLQELLPHVTLTQLRERLPYFKNPETMERYLDGLRKAGLPE